VNRRELIVALGGALAGPLAARAQQAAMPVIGFLFASSPDTNPDRLRGFQRGLKESGYIEGENVAFASRSAEGQYDRLPSRPIWCADRSLSSAHSLNIRR
jgi:hypothetical protein